MNRRLFLKSSMFSAMSVVLLPVLSCTKTLAVPGLLSVPDNNGLLLPSGAKSRIIAVAGELLGRKNYQWHSGPDGSGVIATNDGGWLLISNSELRDNKGGVSVIRFTPNGETDVAYSILKGSNRNCGGMVTPWKTWLSGEEVENGIVWECDPFGKTSAYVVPELGAFKHEFITMDPESEIMYLSEDDSDGCFYRFVPRAKSLKGRDYFSGGQLQVAELKTDSSVVWHVISDPSAKRQQTRYQVKKSTAFRKMEGIAYNNRQIFFDSVVYKKTGPENKLIKYSKIWRYDIPTGQLTVFYDAEKLPDSVLTGADTIVVRDNALLIAEDGGDMQIVSMDMQGNTKVILQLIGQDASEITGIALSPDQKRLYFNSQRGKSGKWSDGITYEVTGLF